MTWKKVTPITETRTTTSGKTITRTLWGIAGDSDTRLYRWVEAPPKGEQSVETYSVEYPGGRYEYDNAGEALEQFHTVTAVARPLPSEEPNLGPAWRPLRDGLMAWAESGPERRLHSRIKGTLYFDPKDK